MMTVKYADMKAAAANIMFARACGRTEECETVLDGIFAKYGYEPLQVVCRMTRYANRYILDIGGGRNKPRFLGAGGHT